jgi:hypothetical protein
MNSFFTLHSFLKVGKTQDLSSKFWQTLGDALRNATKPSMLLALNSSQLPQKLDNVNS